MILGVLSDTHLARPTPALERLLGGALGAAEVLLHAGDFTGEAVLDHLEFVDPRPFYGVCGNMDPSPLARRLPSRRVEELGGVAVGLVHGWGAPEGLAARVLAGFREPPPVVIFGHSHRPLRVRHGSTWLINPGSALRGRAEQGSTVALVTLGAGDPAVTWQRVAA